MGAGLAELARGRGGIGSANSGGMRSLAFTRGFLLCLALLCSLSGNALASDGDLAKRLVERAERRLAPVAEHEAALGHGRNDMGSARMRALFARRKIVERTQAMAKRLGAKLPRDFRRIHYTEHMPGGLENSQIRRAWEMMLDYKSPLARFRKAGKAGAAMGAIAAIAWLGRSGGQEAGLVPAASTASVFALKPTVSSSGASVSPVFSRSATAAD